MELTKWKRTRFNVLFTVLMLLLCSITDAKAQTFAEFFRQKKTQQRYLLQQIAALEVYANYLKKGYEIANTGLQTIKDLSDGEFNLHNTFITGLKKVNPVIRNNVKVAQIIEMQLDIGKAFKGIKSNPNLSVSNLLYVQEVKENLWEESLTHLEEMVLVITAGKVEMGDKERLERLDRIYVSMSEKAAFVQHFTSEIGMFIKQKELEKQTIEQLRKSYGIQE